jgi:spore coat polysaccharide biosynthesis protein SpsF
MKTGVILQARIGSSRFPGKVMRPLPFHGSTSSLQHIVTSVLQTSRVDVCIVATTEHPADDVLTEYTDAPVFRGSETDVLDRYWNAARTHHLDRIIRLTGDNPCIQAELLETLVHVHEKKGYEYSCFAEVPLGLHAEIFSAEGLARAHREAGDPYEREHVTPYFYRHPELFTLGSIPVALPPIVRMARLTLDYPSDYAMLNVIFTRFPEGRFSMEELGAFLEEQPWLLDVNRNYQKSDRSPDEQLREAISILEQRELFAPAALLREAVKKVNQSESK